MDMQLPILERTFPKVFNGQLSIAKPGQFGILYQIYRLDLKFSV